MLLVPLGFHTVASIRLGQVKARSASSTRADALVSGVGMIAAAPIEMVTTPPCARSMAHPEQFHGQPDVLSQYVGSVQVSPRHQQDELFAAIPRHQVTRTPRVGADRLGHQAQAFVTCGMAIAVVIGL